MNRFQGLLLPNFPCQPKIRSRICTFDALLYEGFPSAACQESSCLTIHSY